MDLYGASQMKQQSAGRHVVPLAYIIFIPSTQVFDLTPLSCVLSGQGANTNVIGFDLTRPGPEPERCIWKHYLYLFLLHSNLFFNQELFPFERGTMLVQVYFFNIEKDNYCIGLLTTPCWTYNSCVFVPLKFVILPTAVSSNFVSVNCRVLVKIEIFVDIWIRDFDTWKWLLMLFMFYVAHKISWCEWKLKKKPRKLVVNKWKTNSQWENRSIEISYFITCPTPHLLKYELSVNIFDEFPVNVLHLSLNTL